MLTYFQKLFSNGTIILIHHRGKINGPMSTTPLIRVLMDSLCHRLHDNRLLAIHPVSTKHSMSGLFLILCRSRAEFAYLPPFPLSSRETTPKHFSPICFHHLNHRSNGTTKLRLPKTCGRCSCREMVDQRDTRGWEDRILC